MTPPAKLPDLKKLQHAITLADSGSYARACDQLCLTQSALTRSIQTLERDLGTTLFDRTTRKVRLTSDGEYIIGWARELVASALALGSDIDRLNQADAGRVAFGVGPAMPSLFLPRLLTEFHTLHPGLSMDVTIETPATLLQQLAEDRIELFIAETAHIQFRSAEQFCVQELANLSGGFYVRRGHPLASEAPVRADRLADFTLLTTHYQQHQTHSEQLLNQLSSRHILCNDLNSLRQLLLHSDAVMVGLEAVVAGELAQGSVRRLELDSSMPVRHCAIGVVTRRHRSLSRAASEINQWLSHYFATPRS